MDLTGLQKPLFFIVSEKGPVNQIVQVNNRKEFVDTYGYLIHPYFYESFIYALRLVDYTPVLCYRVVDTTTIVPNLTFAIINRPSNTFAVAGYINAENQFVYKIHPANATSYTTENYYILAQISANTTGQLNNADAFIKTLDNNLFIYVQASTYKEVFSLTAIPYFENKQNYSVTIAESFTTNTEIRYLNRYNSYTSFTVFSFSVLSDMLLSWQLYLPDQKYRIHFETEQFKDNLGEFSIDRFINSLTSTQLPDDIFIKYIVSPLKYDFSTEQIQTINSFLYNYCLYLYNLDLGCLLYIFENTPESAIKNNLVVSFNQYFNTYVPEIGKIVKIPIHYAVIYELLQRRTIVNNTYQISFESIQNIFTSTTHAYIKITNNEKEYLIHNSDFNFAQYSTNGIILTSLFTTDKYISPLKFEHINADIIDLKYRLKKALLPFVHQLNTPLNVIKNTIVDIINTYHKELLYDFSIDQIQIQQNTILVNLTLYYIKQATPIIVQLIVK